MEKVDAIRNSLEEKVNELVSDMIRLSKGEPVESRWLLDDIEDEKIKEDMLTLHTIKGYIKSVLNINLDALVTTARLQGGAEVMEEQNVSGRNYELIQRELDQEVETLKRENTRLTEEKRCLEEQRAHLLKERFLKEYNRGY